MSSKYVSVFFLAVLISLVWADDLSASSPVSTSDAITHSDAAQQLASHNAPTADKAQLTLAEFVKSIQQLSTQSKHSDLFSFEQVEIRQSNLGGYGIFAKTPFQQGESVLSLPRDVLISHDSIWSHSGLATARKLVDSGDLFNSSAFALWLYEESHRLDSPWLHYFSVLPQVFHNAYYANEQDFNILEQLLPASTPTGAAIRQVIMEPKSMLIAQYAVIKEKVFHGKESAPNFLAKLPSFEEFRRWLCVALTRSWSVDGRYILSPIIDFFNHDSTALPPVFSSDAVSVYVNRNVSAGEEIFLSYGQKSDLDLLLLYGFVPQINVFNGYAFRVSANPLYPQLVQDYGLSTEQKILYDGSLPFSAINLFRILHVNADEYTLGQYKQITDGGLVSWRNEREALKSMVSLFKGFLQEMSTTVQQDEFNLQRVIRGELQLTWFSISLVHHFLKQKLLLNSGINTIGNYWLALLQA